MVKKKVRTPIIWFSIFMSLMLFQTSYMSLGTLAALITLILTIFTAFTSGNISVNRFRIPRVSQMLIIFLFITSVVTIATGNLPSYYIKYVAQILLCIILMAMPSLNKSEDDYLRMVFIVAAVFYAFLVVYSCYRLGDSRYYHADIVLFNTSLDPNFIGIPFVSASVLVLDNILTGKKLLINIGCYAILILTIVYTASRGNMLCLLISNALVFLVFLQKKEVPLWFRTMWSGVVIIAVLYMSGYLALNFAQQWERITTLGDGIDNGRFELWARAVNVWEKSPIVGNGLGTMYRIYGKATHNTYFQLLSETGVLGLVIFGGFVVKLLFKMFKTQKVFFCLLFGCLIQIALLDALDNRCLWIILCWLSLKPERRELANDELEENSICCYTKS